MTRKIIQNIPLSPGEYLVVTMIRPLDVEKRTHSYANTFKNSVPIWMKYEEICDPPIYSYELLRFEDGRPIQIPLDLTCVP